MNRAVCIALALALCLALCVIARSVAAEERPLVLALYAPTAPLSSAEARFAYVDKLAQQLTASGIPAQGKAFARATDLDAAIRKGQVDLAILDALYLAERSSGYPVLAATTVGGDTTSKWALYTSLSKGNLPALSGSKLSWAQVGGREPAYLDNILLEGEIRTGQFFDLRPPSPDIGAALSEVALRRADCVFAPEALASGKGLRKVYDAGRILNPALVLVSTKMSRDLVARTTKVLTSSATLGGLDGFRALAGDPYKVLRGKIQGKAARRLYMAEPQPLLTVLKGSILLQEERTPALLPLPSLFYVPPGIP